MNKLKIKGGRVVLDTNILISAALTPKGKPRKVVDTIRDKNGMLLFSDETFNEAWTRLLRTKFDRYVSRGNRLLYLAELRTASEWVTIFGDKMGCQDPDDDKFLETALRGEAACIVTGDGDLLEMSPYRNLPIMNASNFLSKFP